MEDLIRWFLESTLRKICGLVLLCVLCGGIVYGIYFFAFRTSEETPEVDPLARAVATAKKKPIAKNPPKADAKSAPQADEKSLAKAQATAADNPDGPKPGNGEPKHVYKIEPFGKVSLIRVSTKGDRISQSSASAVAIRLSEQLVLDADRFSVAFFENDAFLTDWKGDASLSDDERKNCIWRISTVNRGDRTFQIERIERPSQFGK